MSILELDLESLSPSSVGQILGVTRQQVDIYKKSEPRLRFEGRNNRGATCRMSDLLVWVAERAVVKAKREGIIPIHLPPDPDSGETLPPIEVSQAKKEAMLAEKHFLDVQARRGELVEIASVETAQANRVARSRSRFLGMGAKLGPRLEDRPAPYIQRVIDAEVEEALTELSRGDDEPVTTE